MFCLGSREVLLQDYEMQILSHRLVKDIILELSKKVRYLTTACQHEASDSITDNSVLLKSAGANNIFYLRLCDRDICLKKLSLIWVGTNELCFQI